MEKKQTPQIKLNKQALLGEPKITVLCGVDRPFLLLIQLLSGV